MLKIFLIKISYLSKFIQKKTCYNIGQSKKFNNALKQINLFLSIFSNTCNIKHAIIILK